MNYVTNQPVSAANYNQAGQKIGRKGRETRERILASFLKLIGEEDGPPVTLTSVAREAGVRLPNLYVYFPDIGNLLLAGLARVMATAEDDFPELLRRRWPDEGLQQVAHQFLTMHLAFWKSNARLLHMRNALADAGDLRVLEWRARATHPQIDMLTMQMDCHDDAGVSSGRCIATVLMTGIERIATVATNPNFAVVSGMSGAQAAAPEELIEAEAEVVALAIAHRRQLA